MGTLAVDRPCVRPGWDAPSPSGNPTPQGVLRERPTRRGCPNGNLALRILLLAVEDHRRLAPTQILRSLAGNAALEHHPAWGPKSLPAPFSPSVESVVEALASPTEMGVSDVQASLNWTVGSSPHGHGGCGTSSRSAAEPAKCRCHHHGCCPSGSRVLHTTRLARRTHHMGLRDDDNRDPVRHHQGRPDGSR